MAYLLIELFLGDNIIEFAEDARKNKWLKFIGSKFYNLF